MPRLLDHLAPAYDWLAALDPSLPRALFVALVFGAVLAWRKWSPDTWRAYSQLIPVSEEQSSRFTAVLRKTWQALPSVAISAIAGALGTGGDVGATLKVALLGLLPPVIHELGWRYQGALGDGRPLVPPSLPPSTGASREHIVFPQDDDGRPLELRLVLPCALALLLLGCSGFGKPPCDESKLKAIDEDYVAKVTLICLPKHDRKEDCPEWPALKVEHKRRLAEECGTVAK